MGRGLRRSDERGTGNGEQFNSVIPAQAGIHNLSDT